MAVNPKAYRAIDSQYLRRAEKVPPHEVGTYLDSICVSLHQAVDAWRFHEGSPDEVTLCVDALVALWSVEENRHAD